MAKGKSRWQLADDNFRKQVGHLMVEAKLSKQDVANELGISQPTWRRYLESPSTMKKVVERKLAMLFERHGMRYDPTMGEGAGA